MLHNKVYYGFFLVVFVAIIVAIVLARTQENPLSKIRNFDDCVKAGYPVVQGYPMECSLPNGQFYVRQVMPGR